MISITFLLIVLVCCDTYRSWELRRWIVLTFKQVLTISTQRNVWRLMRRICIMMPGLKGLRSLGTSLCLQKILFKSKLKAFTYTENGLRTPRGRYEVISWKEYKRSSALRLKWFLLDTRGKLANKAAWFFFQVFILAIRGTYLQFILVY